MSSILFFSFKLAIKCRTESRRELESGKSQAMKSFERNEIESNAKVNERTKIGKNEKKKISLKYK